MREPWLQTLSDTVTPNRPSLYYVGISAWHLSIVAGVDSWIFDHKGCGNTNPKLNLKWLTTVNHTTVCVVQGKGVARHSASGSRGGTSYARPSQASSLTHLHEIKLEHYLNFHSLCNVGVWCMCAPQSPPQSGTTRCELHVVYKIVHVKKGQMKVKCLLSLCWRVHAFSGGCM